MSSFSSRKGIILEGFKYNLKTLLTQVSFHHLNDMMRIEHILSYIERRKYFRAVLNITWTVLCPISPNSFQHPLL